MDYYYGSLDFFIKDDYEKNVETQKVNILIGNSANPTNNHLDILKALSGINLDANSKIIIPSKLNNPIYNIKFYLPILHPRLFHLSNTSSLKPSS